MNVMEINILDSGSTGKIMFQIAQKASERGLFVFTASNKGVTSKKDLLYSNKKSHIYVNSLASFAWHYKIGGLLGLNGFFSIFATIRLLHYIRKKNIHLIHLHNLHNFCFNIPLLFRFIKKHNIPVIWTLHDCWSFTGRCPHFVMTKCNKWQGGCHDCPYPKSSYPQSYVDTSKIMWELKRKWFTGINRCVLVTPSLWLANLVKQSFLIEYPVKVINNGIDLSVFKPTESDFRARYNLYDSKIVLGVAFGWGKSKGLDVFIKLSKSLPAKYQIVLVGTDEHVDATLPANIISIHRTQNQTELAEIYSAADVLANPTREEVLGLVNVESLACGTPVVTFKTGGSPECVDESCGAVVDCDDVDGMQSEIIRICEKKVFSSDACVLHAQLFDMNARYEEYVDLYECVLKK